MSEVILIVTGLILTFSMVGKKAEQLNISAPMVFLTAGVIFYLILQAADLSVIGGGTSPEIIRLIAELTLVVILFHDASTVSWKELYIGLPLRLLLIGLPITLAVIFFVTMGLMPYLDVYSVLLIAAALTPTDAGLGAPTILNPIVPVVVRHTLNVESGVNDGLVTPIVLIAILGLENPGAHFNIPVLVLLPIAIALAIAIVLAPLSSKLIDYSADAGISTYSGRGMSLMMIPLLTWGVSELCGANPFIAAYLTGFGVGFFCRTLKKDHSLSALLEAVTDFLSNTAWFFAGELLVFAFEVHFRWEWVVIAILSLTVLRMIPVYICLLGTGLDIQTISFVGWFGPRGLATVIFALFVVEDVSDVENGHNEAGQKNAIIGVLLTTVLFSVFAHGISASPLAEAYAKWVVTHPLPLNDAMSPEQRAEMEHDYAHMRARGAAMHTSTLSRARATTMNNYRAYREPEPEADNTISPSKGSFHRSEIDAANREESDEEDVVDGDAFDAKSLGSNRSNSVTMINIPYTKQNAVVLSKMRLSKSDIFDKEPDSESKLGELRRMEREAAGAGAGVLGHHMDESGEGGGVENIYSGNAHSNALSNSNHAPPRSPRGHTNH